MEPTETETQELSYDQIILQNFLIWIAIPICTLEVDLF